ncbi:DUF433 domain-containing protein [Candidatus Entotheonella palauensis]|uniref:DUF433 domain-containing protein n=1 Tax=Candidatus Entotheonella gemina TaxID=1429439 RepID=W4MEY7_9BACT|nr:DUF433 domain-containing protein [Candidatus Entotheonella palauensis]ETX08486.1 MAG: hypothetical protein ETSY2_05150 [Candidatus Entotheonella gemina]
MNETYVENRDGDYWIADTRVSLDSVVYAYWEGHSPETIAQSFSALSLEQVYGAIAYYLRHRKAVDTSIKKAEDTGEALRQDLRRQDPVFYDRLAQAKMQEQAAKT